MEQLQKKDLHDTEKYTKLHCNTRTLTSYTITPRQ
jgi:hypothetical protein